MEKKDIFYYKLTILVGPPGFCDIEKYHSQIFDNIDDCIKDRLIFNGPKKCGKHYRGISEETYYKNNEIIDINQCKNNKK